jgi:hypothetical protein
MKCPKCGSEVPEGASFCVNCGATVGGEPEKPSAEVAPPENEKPTEPEPELVPGPEKPAELAESEALDKLPEPDRKLEEPTPEAEKPPKREEQPPKKTEEPYRDYRKPITAVIFIIVIVCSIFACCAFCVVIASVQGYGY